MTATITELSAEQLDALIARVTEAAEHGLSLSSEDLRLLLSAIVTLAELQERMAESDITLQKLRKLAGIVKSSEKLSAVVPGAGKSTKPKRSKKKPKGEGKKPRPSAVVHERCHHQLEGLAKGDECPECRRGKLYKYEPAVVLRISGQTPLISTQHVLERLRCNTCGAYYTAEAPVKVQQDGGIDQRYGFSARALMALQKYFAGAPFYRQQTLQQLFDMPVSASTIFDQCEKLADALQPLFLYLILLARDAELYYIDDTTNRVLSQGSIEKPDRRTGKLKKRSGLYTSAAVAQLSDGQRCVLYQTNIGHAGEWLDEILRGRPKTAPPPMVMSDALSANRPSIVDTYERVLCNSHARREFVDQASSFPEPVAWVLEQYGQIWDHERHCQEQPLSAEQRLAYHREQSLAVMKRLRDWGQQQLDSGDVEANSGLGKAIGYLLRYYAELTAFCRLPGAPIDNNYVEQMLKLVIRGRKNSLFFKTPAGAAIADVITSVIATAHVAEINVFEYLIVLQRHAEHVKSQPQHWLPWTYQATVETAKKAA